MRKVIEVIVEDVVGTPDVNVTFRDGFMITVPKVSIEGSEPIRGVKQILKLREAGFTAEEIIEMKREGLL